MYFKQMISLLLYILSIICVIRCNKQIGPDPWDYDVKSISQDFEEDIPPDLKIIPNKKPFVASTGPGDWFYKRLLAIVLKGGDVKNKEDGSVDITLQMKYSHEKWQMMEEYILANTILTEDILRRSVGYIEDSIHKPTIIEKIAMAWGEYVQFYLTEYKAHLIYLFSFLAVLLSIFWLSNYISRKHVIVLIIMGLYLLEAFVSYKEAESKELERFMKALNTCKWYFWSAECEIPPPDPIIFLKHMNPLKITIRIFSILITEPMLTINETIKIILNDITDGLIYPINIIVYGVLILIFNALIIFLLILIMFNYILNTPLSLGFFGINVGLKQRHRSFNIDNNETPRLNDIDRISGDNLTKILDVCSKALTIQTAPIPNINQVPLITKSIKGSTMKRSASTGRLPNLSYGNGEVNHMQIKYRHNGSGDA